jgi:AraC-like DNA-binding protein
LSEPRSIEHTTSLGTWRLTRADPPGDLAGVVQELWEVEGRLSPFREALLPNGSTEVMVNLGPPHRVFEGAGSGVWERSWYSGLQERSIFIESLEGTHLISARLTPLGAADLLGVAAPAAASSIVDLQTIVGEDATRLRSNLLAAPSPSARFALLEAFVRARLPGRSPVPPFVREAASRIETTHGTIRIEDLHGELGVSRKHLSVTFRRWLGVTMKAYARIHRFLWTLGQLQGRTSVEWAKLALAAGYSDQAHLVRDFRRVGATSPRDYLARLAPDGDALVEQVSTKLDP